MTPRLPAGEMPVGAVQDEKIKGGNIMKTYCASNEFGLYFVETETNKLNAEDQKSYDFREVHFAELAEYAKNKNISGFVWLEMEKCPEGYYVPVIPE